MSNPKIICFFSIATNLGGAERSLLDLVSHLEARSKGKYRPWVLLPQSEGPLLEKLRQNKVAFDVISLPREWLELSRKTPFQSLKLFLNGPGIGNYLNQVSIKLRQEECSLIHTTGLKCHILSVFLSLDSTTKILWHLRDIFSFGPSLIALRFLYFIKKPFLIANSCATAIDFNGKGHKAFVVYNGLDQETFNYIKFVETPELLKKYEGRTLIGVIGVLSRWKGQEEFLEMALRLINAGSDAHFVVVGGEIYDTVGDKGYGLTLRKKAEELGVLDRVTFTGFQKEPLPFLRSLSVLVHASIRPEPFGRVLIEAMACGIPLVATSAGGVTEIAKDHQSALLVRPGDVKAMADAVTEILTNESLRQTLIEGGLSRFQSQFTMDHYVDGVIQSYDTIFTS